jgi:hypothetical protein
MQQIPHAADIRINAIVGGSAAEKNRQTISRSRERAVFGGDPHGPETKLSLNICNTSYFALGFPHP